VKKIIFLISIFITTTFAETTNDQILKKLDNIQIQVNNIQKEVQNIKHNQELLKQEMKLRFEVVDKRFEVVDKRFESIDKRFESIDKRFESIDKRFETLTNFVMTLTAGIFGLIGFMMWDRRTVAQKVKEECNQEIETQSKIIDTKADKEYVDRFVKAMNELLVLKDETAINIFRKYNLL
jgi:uncharacterized protein YoxC